MKPSTRAIISGIGSRMPEQIITNRDLEKMVDTNDAWIQSRTGIQERRQASPLQAASDLATEASEKALAVSGLSADLLDAIIVATSTPDMVFPSTACVVQQNLGAHKAFAYDISAACSGFLFALSNATQYIENGTCQNILVIGVDLMTHLLDFQDRNTCVLFGDGAGAVVLSAHSQEPGILGSKLASDGRFGDILYVPAGGTRMPLTTENISDRQQYIQMNGSEVFKMAVRSMEQTARTLLEDTGVSMEDVDWLIPHQANQRIIDTLGKRLNIPRERVFVNLHLYGNMSAASIPVALDEAWRSGLLKAGQTILMLAFGAGLTWGASLINWSLHPCPGSTD